MGMAVGYAVEPAARFPQWQLGKRIWAGNGHLAGTAGLQQHDGFLLSRRRQGALEQAHWVVALRDFDNTHL